MSSRDGERGSVRDGATVMAVLFLIFGIVLIGQSDSGLR